MLEPREADLPVLILVLVVLPLVTYFLLGIWSETSKRKPRISMLAQLAAEEALRVEDVPPVVVTPRVTPYFTQHFTPHSTPNAPSSKISSYECAKCFAPATTRCSKCKSVRYCSGKCQIMHWRQRHKQECHQLAIMRSLSSNADSIQSRAHVENSKQVLEYVIDKPLHSDFLSDVSSDGSLATNNISYDTASEKRLSSSEKRVSRKQKTEKRETLTSNNLACALEDASTHDVDNPTLLGNKLGSGSFTSVEVNDHAPTALTNVKHQHHKITGETRTPHKLRFTRDSVKNVVNECETSTNLTSECRFSSSNEALDSNSMAEDASFSGSIMYKRPPYILGSTTTSLSQKSAEKILHDESRVSASSACKSVQLQNSNGVSGSLGSKMSGSRKSSKVHKWNLVGLMNDGSKNKMLFPYEDLVKFFQCEVWGIYPRGLFNCGNSCYANAVLQCLTCTKPLMIYLLRRSHSKSCRIRDWCLLCKLEEHVSMLREGGGPLSPSRVLSNMRNIGCRMGGGNQEDAHEFLRLLVMSMQSICLAGLGGEKEVNPKLQETTLIQQIFGGRLKSKVKCLRCHLESERYENIMDLTLEIHGWVESLEDALTQFTAPEDLDGENMYRCGRCAAYVKARKQLSVHEVPNILTIVLKRFQTGKYGKINKCVTFPDMLDMIPFVTGTSDSPPLYMLYGVVVHLDTQNASFSGHYVSYVKDLQGTWFRIDDSEVQAVPLSEVMSEGAYMLFYSRSFPRPPRTYTEKTSLHAAHKTQKTSRHGQQKQTVAGFVPHSSGNGNLETFTDSVSMDYSDVTSSDWSLFTSSDESSFTTDESSIVDHSDSSGLDPITSIFAPPFYIPEYPQNNSISCAKPSPCRAQTRFFSERQDFVMDESSLTHPQGSVHRDRISKEGSTRF